MIKRKTQFETYSCAWQVTKSANEAHRIFASNPPEKNCSYSLWPFNGYNGEAKHDKAMALEYRGFIRDICVNSIDELPVGLDVSQLVSKPVTKARTTFKGEDKMCIVLDNDEDASSPNVLTIDQVETSGEVVDICISAKGTAVKRLHFDPDEKSEDEGEMEKEMDKHVSTEEDLFEMVDIQDKKGDYARKESADDQHVKSTEEEKPNKNIAEETAGKKHVKSAEEEKPGKKEKAKGKNTKESIRNQKEVEKIERMQGMQAEEKSKHEDAKKIRRRRLG